jgi:hypothetical protein
MPNAAGQLAAKSPASLKARCRLLSADGSPRPRLTPARLRNEPGGRSSRAIRRTTRRRPAAMFQVAITHRSWASKLRPTPAFSRERRCRSL